MIKFTLDGREGKRLEIVEDFSRVGIDKRYKVIYEPLYSINENGLRTFEKVYAVYIENGTREKIGIVSASYTPVSLSAEIEFLIDLIKKYEEIRDITLSKNGEVVSIDLTLGNKRRELDIIPYEIIVGKSAFYNPYFEIDRELMERGFRVVNSYTGKVANSVNNLFKRVICKNGVIEKAVGFRIPHKIKKEEIERKLVKIINLKSRMDKLLGEKGIERKLMRTIKEKEVIMELKWIKERFKIYNVAEKEYRNVLEEIKLMKEARDGKVKLWDFANIYTALATHRLNKKRNLANQLNEKFIALITNATN
jgi:hypothetical protein